MQTSRNFQLHSPPIFGHGVIVEGKINLPTFYPTSEFPNYRPQKIQINETSLRLSNLRVDTYDIEGLDSNQKILWKNSFQIASETHNDVLDILPFFEKNGEYWIVLSEVPRYGMLARDSFELPNPHTGYCFELPGGFLINSITGEDLELAKKFILTDKFGVKPIGELEFLSASSKSSSSAIAETRVIRTQQIEPLNNNELDVVRFDHPFHISIRRVALPITQVVEQLYDGTLVDSRLFSAALTFAKQKKIDISTSFEKKTVPQYSLKPEFPKILTYDEILQISKEQSNTFRKAVSYNVKPNPNPEFTRIGTTDFNFRFLSDQPIRERDLSVCSRLSEHGDILDSVDYLPYFLNSDGKAIIQIQRSLDPASIITNELPHSIYTESRYVSFTSLSASVNAYLADNELEDYIQNAIEIRYGLTPISFDYISKKLSLSSGSLTEMTQIVLCQIDPNQVKNNSSDIIYLELNDLRKLIDEGVIRDHRLNLAAENLALLLEYEKDSHSLFDQYPEEEVSELLDVLNKGSTLTTFLRRFCPEMHRSLMTQSIVRKLMAWSSDHRGLLPIQLSDQSELKLFRGCLPFLTVYEQSDKRSSLDEFQGNTIHDAWHQVIDEYLPFKFDSSGNIQYGTREDYIRFNMEGEIRVVYLSEYLLSKSIGLETAKDLSWRWQIASVISEAGIPEKEVENVIEDIMLNGRIDKRILASESYQNQNPELTLGLRKLIKFGIEGREVLNVFYDGWMENPTSAKVLYEFGYGLYSSESFYRSLHIAKDRIDKYPEGSNPLKSENMEYRNSILLQPALYLAAIKDIIDKYSNTNTFLLNNEYKELTEEINNCIKLLIDENKRLTDVWREIKTNEPSAENLEIRKDLFLDPNQSTINANALINKIKTDYGKVIDLLSKSSIAARYFPGFPSQYLVDGEKVNQMVIAREIDECLRHQVSYPC